MLADDSDLRKSLAEAGGMVQGALMLLPSAPDSHSPVSPRRASASAPASDAAAQPGDVARTAGAAADAAAPFMLLYPAIPAPRLNPGKSSTLAVNSGGGNAELTQRLLDL